MPSYKDSKTNTWYCKFYYMNREGVRRQKLKRGFKLKKDADSWERSFIENLKESPDMPFRSLVAEYLKDKKATRKPVTYRTSESRVRVWILPYFGDRPADSITTLDVKKWHEYLRQSQNEHGQSLAAGYIGTLHRELSIIFNYGIKYYGLKQNPAAIVGNVKGSKSKSLQFWTLDQFTAFINTFEASDPWRATFMLLYWTGCRVGECQALTIQDIDFNARKITINKTFHLIAGEGNVTSPKTAASERVITINKSLADVLANHISRLYAPEPGDRLFTMTPSAYGKQMKKHATLADLPQIRVHDLRHSHASLLIELGFSPLLIAQRLGHDNVSMTLNIYSHLWPSKQDELADRLEKLF